MATFEQGDIVKVPFPYTDRSTRQRRPALVLSTGAFRQSHGLLWVIMITSAGNRAWSGDIRIADHLAAGLPAPSLIRTAKFATIDAADAEALGAAPSAVLQTVLATIAGTLGLS